MATQVVDLSSSESDDEADRHASVCSSETAPGKGGRNRPMAVGCGHTNVVQGQRRRPQDSPTLLKIRQATKDGEWKKVAIYELQSYLRSHNLRVAGSKAVLVERVTQHLESQRGGLKSKYPPASFLLYCRGDVCRGDVIKFKERVPDSNQVRTTAGRVLKESYGEKKQQHTFTLESLWSKGPDARTPLQQFLIKGRTLYSFPVYRQVWADENERKKCLEEKHERGDKARALQRQRIPNSGFHRESGRQALAKKRRLSQLCRGSRPLIANFMSNKGKDVLPGRRHSHKRKGHRDQQQSPSERARLSGQTEARSSHSAARRELKAKRGRAESNHSGGSSHTRKRLKLK